MKAAESEPSILLAHIASLVCSRHERPQEDKEVDRLSAPSFLVCCSCGDKTYALEPIKDFIVKSLPVSV